LVKVYPNDERAHNLLGLNFFGQQEYAQAIEEFKKATKINPEFSQPYNQMGYAYRFLEDYNSSEEAFKQYIKLIPDDPNPYDSYAELLLKMGKYDESVKYYKKALAVNPNFVASHIGIATNFNYMGKHEDARKQLKELYDMARNNGERRAVHFATTVSYVAEGNFVKAQEELEMQYALAEKINDAAAMAGDFGTMGNILLEAGEIDEALTKFEKSVKLIQGSDLSQEVKNNSKRFFLFNRARIALKKNDFKAAKTNAKEFQEQVKSINNPFQIRLSHGLVGMIALGEKDFDKAIEELEQANQQNPYTFYRMAQAYEGRDNKEKAKEFYKKAANFNALNSLNQVFIRSKAKKKLTEM
jgi:tetratricopeptide (TPR) repeat protein